MIPNRLEHNLAMDQLEGCKAYELTRQACWETMQAIGYSPLGEDGKKKYGSSCKQRLHLGSLLVFGLYRHYIFPLYRHWTEEEVLTSGMPNFIDWWYKNRGNKDV